MAEENNTPRENGASPPAPSLREQIMRELRDLFNARHPDRVPEVAHPLVTQAPNTVFKAFTSEERDYYLKVHGFDPVAGRIPLPGDKGFKYEIKYPLEKDPALLQAGVTIGARVEVNPGTRPHNRIIFNRGNKEAIVNCVHTAICKLPVGDAVNLPETLLNADTTGGSLLERVASTEKLSLVLPPEEHFASLKSYVAGIAEMGLTNVLCASYHSEAVNPTTLPFGFNSEMQNQIARALREIAPETTKILVQDVLAELIQGVPSDWILPRVELLNGMYDFEHAIFTDPAAFEAVFSTVPNPILFQLAAQFHSTHPDIVFLALEESNSKIVAEIALKWLFESPQSYSFIADPTVRLRALIATHQLTSTYVLDALATDLMFPVRKAVARHHNTSLLTLEQLAQDKDATVRVAVESRETLTPRIRVRLHEGKYYPENFPEAYCGVSLLGPEALALGEFERIMRKEIPYLKKLPKGVGGFVVRNGRVSALRITGTMMQVIPSAIQHLTALHTLDFSFNRLVALPPELSHLHNLKVLNLSMNELTTKPAFFSAWVARLQANGCTCCLAQRYNSRILTSVPKTMTVDILRGGDLFPMVRPEEDNDPGVLKASLFDEMRLRLQMKLDYKLE